MSPYFPAFFLREPASRTIRETLLFYSVSDYFGLMESLRII